MKLFRQQLPAALLVLLFTYAAASKLLAGGTFLAQLRAQPFSPALAAVLQWLLPASELACAVLLLTEKTRRAGLILALS